MPIWTQYLGFGWLALELSFLILMVAGLVTVHRWVSSRLFRAAVPMGITVAEAVLVVPWLLFPVLLVLSLVGQFRVALVAAQVALVILGIVGLVRSRSQLLGALRSFVCAPDGRFDLVRLLATATVGLFLVWPWMVPFSEPFNGHHHDLLSLVQNLWTSGHYHFLPLQQVSYDTEPLALPPNTAFYLSLFSVPGITPISVHPIFFLPGLSALLTLLVFRKIAGGIAGASRAGDLAFLLVAPGYYVAGAFSSIHPDIWSPILLGYLIWLLLPPHPDPPPQGGREMGNEIGRYRTPDLARLGFILVFTALTRLPLFVLCVAVVAIALAISLVRQRRIQLSSLRPAAAVLVLPALLWVGLMMAEYHNPVFPFFAPRALAVFSFTSPPSVRPVLVAPDGTHRTITVNLREQQAAGVLHFQLPAVADLRMQFFPLVLSRDLVTLGETLFAAFSLSTVESLGLLAVLLGLAARGSPFRATAFIVSGAFLVTWFLVFISYPRFPWYLGPLAAIAAALAIIGLGGKLAGLPFVAGVAIIAVAVNIHAWGFASWGHALADPSFQNISLLWPYNATPLERLARAADRSPDSVRREIDQYSAAVADVKRNGGQILLTDLEPGAQIPSLLDLQPLADALYLENVRSEPVYQATTLDELRAALTRLQVRYVYRPGRAHPDFQQTLILQRVQAYEAAPGGDAYLIPVDDLFR